MFRRRYGQQRVASQRFVIDQGRVLASQKQLARLLLKAHGPVKRSYRMTTPGVRVQVVHKVAAADYQNAFVTQRRQTFTNFVMKLRRLGFINAELHNSRVSIRKNVAKYRPGAVIQTPTVIEFHRQWPEQFSNSWCPGQRHPWSSHALAESRRQLCAPECGVVLAND